MTGLKYLRESINDMKELIISLPLKRFETKSLKHSLRMSRIGEYEHGELIVDENDADPYIYFLLSGKVRLKKEGTEIGIIDSLGEIFGDVEILNDLVRWGTVYAEGEAVCLAINASSVISRFTSDRGADILLSLYRVFTEYLAIRLRLLTEELVKTKKEIERLNKRGVRIGN